MTTYTTTQKVLNVQVSCFPNYGTPSNPLIVNLSEWLKSEQYCDEINALRKVDDKSERNSIKATLPAITPSAVFTYRKEADMIPGSHTGLIQFDIDPKDNTRISNYAELKEQIKNLPFIAYCSLSASGKGYWGLVPIVDTERHRQHFDALEQVFAHYGIKIDTMPRNVASLRGYSYDPDPYQPEQVMLFDLYLPTKPKLKPQLRTLDFVNRPTAIITDADRKRFEVCIQEILRLKTYLGDRYEDWYVMGCGLANSFGESGREYYHLVSQNYPGYQPDETDKQFTACLGANSQATLGTFFHLSKQRGIEWRTEPS